MVIVSGWGKQFLQRFPETLMEVRFNLCPRERDASALHWTLLLHVAPQGLRVLGRGWMRERHQRPRLTSQVHWDFESQQAWSVLRGALVSKHCSVFL